MNIEVGSRVCVKRGRGWSTASYSVKEIDGPASARLVNLGLIGKGTWVPLDKVMLLQDVDAERKRKADAGKPTLAILNVLTDRDEWTVEQLKNRLPEFEWSSISGALAWLNRCGRVSADRTTRYKLKP